MSPSEPAPAAQGSATAPRLKAICLRSMQIMADADLADFEAVIHPDAVNREASIEPPDCRGRGPAAFHAAARWLRAAFADMAWDIHQVAAEGDIVAVHSTWSGRQVGPFVTYDDSGAVSQAMPPTGKTFTATQTHWFRLADGKVIDHWANRDDLAVAQQLGWVPPSPRYLARMALAKRRARNAA